MRSALIFWLLLGLLGDVQAQNAPVQLSGQLRWQWDGVQANAAGPWAAAHALQPNLLNQPVAANQLEAELQLSGHGVTAIMTLHQQDTLSSPPASQAWVNELYASHDAGTWQLSVGKKIVAWDVGFGFRPNDMVQQEERRTLVNRTQQGRPLLLAEHFSSDTAWSWVWVNPTASEQAVNETALAARVYQRQGAADWYGFARLGARTGASTGVALAWVANEALELHGSLRYSRQSATASMNSGTQGLVGRNPWLQVNRDDVAQWLLGGTWTSQNQFSLLAETWWDGAAPSDAQWSEWSDRNRQLATLAAPAAAVAGNLAWQAEGLTGRQNLRRRNLLLRLSWENGAWKPAFDVLYTPADQGKALTATLTWQGDRVQVQTGLRSYTGPSEALLAQLPSRQQAFLALTWAF